MPRWVWIAIAEGLALLALGAVALGLLGPVRSSCRDDETRVWRQGPRVISVEADPNCRYGR